MLKIQFLNFLAKLLNSGLLASEHELDFLVRPLIFKFYAKFVLGIYLPLRDYVPRLAQLQDPDQVRKFAKFARQYADEIKLHRETARNWYCCRHVISLIARHSIYCNTLLWII